jgi:hypothetical protein
MVVFKVGFLPGRLGLVSILAIYFPALGGTRLLAFREIYALLMGNIPAETKFLIPRIKRLTVNYSLFTIDSRPTFSSFYALKTCSSFTMSKETSTDPDLGRPFPG